jgi:transmembrane sensor
MKTNPQTHGRFRAGAMASPAANPGDVDAIASKWLVRQRSGLNETEQQELSSWLGSDIAHADAYSRMSDMAAVLQRARAQGASSTILAELAARGRKRRTRRVVATSTLAAALVIFAVGRWSGFNQESSAAPAPIAAQNADSLRRLPDGSIVELNRHAEIVVKFDSAVRLVELVRGEALFRAEKDPARPFVVRAAGVEVRAVGTAFNVRVQPTGVEVLVTEGKVGVDDVARGKSLLPSESAGSDRLLVAGEKLVVAIAAAASASRTVEVSQVSAAEIKAQLAWRVPRLEFEGVLLAQAVEQMNRYNRIQISVGDEDIAQLRISGTFLTDDPQTFARLAAATFGLEARQRSDSEIVLQKIK